MTAPQRSTAAAVAPFVEVNTARATDEVFATAQRALRRMTADLASPPPSLPLDVRAGRVWLAEIASISNTVLDPTVATAQLEAPPPGRWNPTLRANPHLLAATDGQVLATLFVIGHELLHHFPRHLNYLADAHRARRRGGTLTREQQFFLDPMYKQWTDAWNNRQLRLAGIPTPVLTVNGEQMRFVDDQDVYADYVRRCEVAGLAPRAESDFYRSWFSIKDAYDELPEDQRPRPATDVVVCAQVPTGEGDACPTCGADASGTGGAGADEGAEQESGAPTDDQGGPGQGSCPTCGNSDPHQADPGAFDDAFAEAVRNLVERAQRDPAAEQALRDLIDAAGDSDAARNFWSSVGADRVVGRASGPTTPADNLLPVLHARHRSLTTPGRTFVPDHTKLGWDDELRDRLGIPDDLEFPMVPRGKTRTSLFVVGLDTSGSMPAQFLQAMADDMVDHISCTVLYLTCDTDVHAIEPGQPLRGGGGTDMQQFVDWCAAFKAGQLPDADQLPRSHRRHLRGRFPDGLTIITDGDCEPVVPPEQFRRRVTIALVPRENSDPAHPTYAGWPTEPSRGLNVIPLPYDFCYRDR